jgi:hypothetical protein
MDTAMWTTVESVVTIVGVIVAALALGVTAYETQMNTRTNKASFWLELRKMFAEHNEVHWNLMTGGAWHASDLEPQPGPEMRKVEAYMGLFEHCKEMLDDKLIDRKTFENVYAYRIDFILANGSIVRQELSGPYREGWKTFVALAHDLGRTVPESSSPSERAGL